MSRVYGLTGGIASGKTTVLDIFKKMVVKHMTLIKLLDKW